MKAYCTQNEGDCSSCSLVNYGKDCMNNPIGAATVERVAVGFSGEAGKLHLEACGSDETQRQIDRLKTYALDLQHEGEPISWGELDNIEEPRTIMQAVLTDRRRRIDSQTIMADRPPFALATVAAGRIVRLEYYEGHDALACIFDLRSAELADKDLPKYLGSDPQAYDPMLYLAAVGL